MKTFDIFMFQDTCEPVCFKLGIVLNTSKVAYYLDLPSCYFYVRGVWKSCGFCRHFVVYSMLDFLFSSTMLQIVFTWLFWNVCFVLEKHMTHSSIFFCTS